jgi:hypothetical protein
LPASSPSNSATEDNDPSLAVSTPPGPSVKNGGAGLGRRRATPSPSICLDNQYSRGSRVVISRGPGFRVFFFHVQDKTASLFSSCGPLGAANNSSSSAVGAPDSSGNGGSLGRLDDTWYPRGRREVNSGRPAFFFCWGGAANSLSAVADSSGNTGHLGRAGEGRTPSICLDNQYSRGRRVVTRGFRSFLIALSFFESSGERGCCKSLSETIMGKLFCILKVWQSDGGSQKRDTEYEDWSLMASHMINRILKKEHVSQKQNGLQKTEQRANIYYSSQKHHLQSRDSIFSDFTNFIGQISNGISNLLRITDKNPSQ